MVSPYPYLQAQRFGELEGRLDITPVPVLFAGLLAAWGQLGPAEIPAKRVQTYRYVHWLAQQREIPFRAPPTHPFNPLVLLRLAIAAGSTVDAAISVLSYVWRSGEDTQNLETLMPLAASLGVEDISAAVNDPDVKAQLRRNTDNAVAAGVYGVPTFQVGETLFWGDDSTDMLLQYLDDPEMLDQEEYKRLANLPTSSVRKQSHV